MNHLLQFAFNNFVLLCATSCLTAREGSRGQSAGGSIAIALATDILRFTGVQHTVAAKQLTAENRRVKKKSMSLSGRLRLFGLAESSPPDMCLLNKQLSSQTGAGCLTHSECRPQTESRVSPWSSLLLTGTCTGTVHPLVVTAGVDRTWNVPGDLFPSEKENGLYHKQIQRPGSRCRMKRCLAAGRGAADRSGNIALQWSPAGCCHMAATCSEEEMGIVLFTACRLQFVWVNKQINYK